MPKTLKIKQTAFPCGTTVRYLGGMDQPDIKNLGQIMKEAAFEYVNTIREGGVCYSTADISPLTNQLQA